LAQEELAAVAVALAELVVRAVAVAQVLGPVEEPGQELAVVVRYSRC
tara:strand:+ start:1181 stop:1321 length:141 start_codon:yes stop_codon:yes gene_type:complete